MNQALPKLYSKYARNECIIHVGNEMKFSQDFAQNFPCL